MGRCAKPNSHRTTSPRGGIAGHQFLDPVFPDDPRTNLLGFDRGGHRQVSQLLRLKAPGLTLSKATASRGGSATALGRGSLRALGVPLAAVNHGKPRHPRLPSSCRIPLGRARDAGHRGDSQADSAGSIPVTRSTREKFCHIWGFVNAALRLPSVSAYSRTPLGHPWGYRHPSQHPPSGRWFSVQVRRWRG